MENTKKRDGSAANTATLLIIPQKAMWFALALIMKDYPNAKITIYLPK
jgi:hypothetical protein